MKRSVKLERCIDYQQKTFTSKLELTFDKTFGNNTFSVVALDFSAKSNQWYKNLKRTHEGPTIVNLLLNLS